MFSTKAQVPSRPGPPICQAVSIDATRISWDIPSGNGSPITDYHCYLRSEASGAFEPTYTGPDPSCNVSGLKVSPQRHLGQPVVPPALLCRPLVGEQRAGR